MSSNNLIVETFERCQTLFQSVPQTCSAEGQCEPGVDIPIVASDLHGLPVRFKCINGIVKYEEYPGGNSLRFIMAGVDGSSRELLLANDGIFIDTKLPPPGSIANAELLRKLADIANEGPEEDEARPASLISPELAESLFQLSARIVAKSVSE